MSTSTRTARKSAAAKSPVLSRIEETFASWKRNIAEGNAQAAAGDLEALRRLGTC